MKTPPLLLGATLVFWGWNTNYLWVGVALGLVLEASRLLRNGWEVTEEDFNRIWTFCTLLFLASTVYAFTSNDGPSDFRGFFENPNPWTTRNAGTASARTAASLIRWLPMTFFLFMAAQACSTRGGVPLETVSLIMRRRWKKARALGQPLPQSRVLDISYFYFALCLFASSIHTSEGQTFFWGFSILVAWALWPMRSPRFGLVPWALTLAVAIGLGFAGQGGMNKLRGYLERLDPTWLTGWGRRGFDPSHSRTELGRIGRVKLSGRIVMRVEAREGPVPSLLRQACYRTYKSETWYSEMSRSSYENIPSETNGITWVLIPGKTNSGSVNIATYLSGDRAPLALPSGSSKLENLNAYVLTKSALGVVMAEGPGLVIFDALFGPGVTLDSDPSLPDDAMVHPAEKQAVEEIIQRLDLKDQPKAVVLRKLQEFFANEFTYSTWHEPGIQSGTNGTPITTFLLRDRRGHCEYFATATVLLLRHLGIPTRYAVGYVVHDGDKGKYVVRERDGHAWCLVWDSASRTWQDFDTTPASWMAEEKKLGTSFQWVSDAWSRLFFEFSRLRWGQTNLRKYILIGVTPILLVLLYQILFRRRNRKSAKAGDRSSEAWPGLDSELYQIETRLKKRGWIRAPGEPLAAWLQKVVQEGGLEDWRQPLEQIIRLHYRYRFDPEGLTPEERVTLRDQATRCVKQLAR